MEPISSLRTRRIASSALRSTNVLSRLYRGFVQNGLAVTLYATEVEK